MPTDRQITSLQNPALKRVLQLRKRADRAAVGLILIEGYRELDRALRHAVRPATLFYCPPLYLGQNEPALVDACREAGAECLECAPAPFRKIAYRDRPDGLLAVAPWAPRALDDLDLPANPLVLVLEGIEKPGNLGTMLRTADAAGVHAVIVCDGRTDLANPNTVRASIGALFTVPVAVADGARLRSWLATRGLRIVAATPHADALYSATDLTGPTAVILGAEQYGLTPPWLAAGTHPVRIPMLGDTDSLNVSAAATILLYEAIRQRTAQ
ncbi:MAG: RNA methyltransferase [Candidatus Marinimicrobia bacterium]|nr:RNA methyltransferase [Candidatus Neomarinimicrobiota bacterium]